MTLAPPLWATDAWAVDVWADGTWATEVTLPVVFGDLTTLYTLYHDALRDANALRTDSPTLIANDLDTVYAGTTNDDDLNTALADYITRTYT